MTKTNKITPLFGLAFIAITAPLLASFGRGLWFEEPAEVTVEEFLSGLFKQQFERPPTDRLESYVAVTFAPDVSPEKAGVVIFKAWNGNEASEEHMHAMISATADATAGIFENLANTPGVMRRWPMKNPRDHLIIFHINVDAEGGSEGVAVTVEGTTVFGATAIQEAMKSVLEDG